ncbi:hypothetical protein [uncultured Anaeromusa sp.]|nr:hypothetical protein [uncultured Anaeromusa sp.]
MKEELTSELFSFFDGFTSLENAVIKSSDLTVAEAHAIKALSV